MSDFNATPVPSHVVHASCCEDTWYNEFVWTFIALCVTFAMCLISLACGAYYKYHAPTAAPTTAELHRSESQRSRPEVADDLRSPPAPPVPDPGAPAYASAPPPISQSPPSALALSRVFQPGDHVEAMFQDEYYPAQIAAVGEDGMMIVNWEDGSHSKDVHPMFVRPLPGSKV
eukprot:TRINITY_DN25406_c0_g1_i1.p2 TRINITY_DN25406_c0_g1~~TRINITY_DN25406_c0_g1_i1.p2  ORF type:complete len:173 (+),score=27.90 TRINITY_DN25406_c0_g1_i1:61-579(+)